jgi:branched-chain amino acid transport system substrate-binding protein
MRKAFYLLAASMLFAASPAFAQDTITIGFTASQTGALNNDSTAQMRGIELWRDDVNGKGGIKVGGKSYNIKLVTYDDESQNTRVQQLYTGSSQYLTGALQALKEKNPKPHIAFVYEDDPFSKAVVQAVRDTAKKQGDVVAADESYAGSTTDFSPVINKIISAKADALLGGGHYADGATLARQLHEQKAGVKWVTLLVAPDSPKFAELGDSAVGISVPSQWEPQAAFKPDFGPTVAAFTQAFTDKYKIAPAYHAAGGYAAGLILQHAIEKAGSTDPVQVAAQLNAMDVTTFFGRTKFSNDSKEHGLQVGHDMVLAQWQKKDGKLVKEVIWPKAAKTADALY